jgi:hypothetical protein
VFFISNGSYFNDPPNSFLLDIEPVLFRILNPYGRFWGKIGEFCRNRPEKTTLVSTVRVGRNGKKNRNAFLEKRGTLETSSKYVPKQS